MSAEKPLIKIQKMAPDLFASFGDIITLKSKPDMIINQGLCGRHHDIANLDFEHDGKAGISLFDAKPRCLPYTLDMMERHPKGSQAFIPMHANPFLVIVASDQCGQPSMPSAFLTAPHMGINIYRNTWHGVLVPLHSPGLFAVIDRISSDTNLEEHWFKQPYVISD